MKSKSVFVLLVVALVSVGLVWVVAQALSSPDGGEVPVASGSMVEWEGIGLPVSLEGAQRRAEEVVSQWRSDAILIRVDGTWRPGVGRLDRQIPPVAWSLYYYSPSARAIASAVVDAEHVFWIPALPMRDGAPDELMPFPPSYEPHEVWLTFKGAGGEQFIRENPDAVVSMVLYVVGGQPEWKVVAASNGRHFEVRIDAETGLVLP
jgi:hypothetical protein